MRFEYRDWAVCGGIPEVEMAGVAKSCVRACGNDGVLNATMRLAEYSLSSVADRR